MNEPFTDFEDARALPRAIVDTVLALPLQLDGDLRVVAASRSFYLTLRVDRRGLQERLIYGLDDPHFSIPRARRLLEKIGSDVVVLDGAEVGREFPESAAAQCLRAKPFEEGNSHSALLLDLEDIADRCTGERKMEELLQQTEELLRQKEVLLGEMRHRIANSLQIIASILMLKARAVTSKETRLHLNDAHRRIISIAAVEEILHASARGDLIQIGPYLSKLCGALAASMIDDCRPVSLQVLVDGDTAAAAQIVSLGLIVTELVINALKHAFPDDRENGRVVVTYETDGLDWRLVVSDNGIRKPQDGAASAGGGLGTALVRALAQQLDARVEFVGGPEGTIVSVMHTTFTSRLPDAA